MCTSDTHRAVAYLLARLIGASLFGHGLARMPKLSSFHAQMTGKFTESMVPTALVPACSYVLPIAELITGVLLLAGALTRTAAIAGGLVMIALFLGATSIEHFSVIGDQLVHALFLVGVIAFRGHNRYSVDRLLAGHRSTSA